MRLVDAAQAASGVDLFLAAGHPILLRPLLWDDSGTESGLQLLLHVKEGDALVWQSVFPSQSKAPLQISASGGVSFDRISQIVMPWAPPSADGTAKVVAAARTDLHSMERLRALADQSDAKAVALKVADELRRADLSSPFVKERCKRYVGLVDKWRTTSNELQLRRRERDMHEIQVTEHATGLCERYQKAKRMRLLGAHRYLADLNQLLEKEIGSFQNERREVANELDVLEAQLQQLQSGANGGGKALKSEAAPAAASHSETETTEPNPDRGNSADATGNGDVGDGVNDSHGDASIIVEVTPAPTESVPAAAASAPAAATPAVAAPAASAPAAAAPAASAPAAAAPAAAAPAAAAPAVAAPAAAAPAAASYAKAQPAGDDPSGSNEAEIQLQLTEMHEHLELIQAILAELDEEKTVERSMWKEYMDKFPFDFNIAGASAGKALDFISSERTHNQSQTKSTETHLSSVEDRLGRHGYQVTDGSDELLIGGRRASMAIGRRDGAGARRRGSVAPPEPIAHDVASESAQEAQNAERLRKRMRSLGYHSLSTDLVSRSGIDLITGGDEKSLRRPSLNCHEDGAHSDRDAHAIVNNTQSNMRGRIQPLKARAKPAGAADEANIDARSSWKAAYESRRGERYAGLYSRLQHEKMLLAQERRILLDWSAMHTVQMQLEAPVAELAESERKELSILQQFIAEPLTAKDWESIEAHFVAQYRATGSHGARRYASGQKIIVCAVNGDGEATWGDAEVIQADEQSWSCRHSVRGASGEEMSVNLTPFNHAPQIMTTEAFSNISPQILGWMQGEHATLTDALSGALLDVTKHCVYMNLSQPPGGTLSNIADVRELGKWIYEKHRMRTQTTDTAVPQACALITAPPAAGKTCLTLQLAMHMISTSLSVGHGKAPLIPILIKIQDLQHELLRQDANVQATFQSKWNWIDAYLSLQHGEDSEPYLCLRQALMARRVVLILDGIDEGGRLVPNHIVNVLVSQGFPIIATSRPFGALSEQLGNVGFQELRLMALSDSQQKDLIAKRVSGPERSEQLVRCAILACHSFIYFSL